MKGPSQRGIALVITLIMLSVITVVAIAFLALSRRERSNVTQMANLTDAEFSAHAAAERAKGEILAQMLSTNNMLGPGLKVSENYINRLGFVSNVSDPTNVNFDFHFRDFNNRITTEADFLQNVANLYYDARVPVFISPSQAATYSYPYAVNPPRRETNYWRFFLDLNRNGQFEDTWPVLPVFDDAGVGVLGDDGSGLKASQVGDPQWIGILEQPNFPHSRTNRFIGRYAYLICPAGRTLDLNYIHNHVKPAPDMKDNGFMRNQGFGSWEINLAAFLAELNTNVWNSPGDAYFYTPDPNDLSRGASFVDARELLRYRYDDSQLNLKPAFMSLPQLGNHFTTDLIDDYANGPLDFSGKGLALADETNDDPNQPWPGSDSLNHFFTIHDFFGEPKFASSTRYLQPPNFKPPYFANFVNHLRETSYRLGSYNKYTYYRMLAQLGTDSTAEPEEAELNKLIQKVSAQKPEDFPAEPIGRLNLNYDNLGQSATNFLSWEPAKFFLNVGNVLLRSQFPFGITNIPVSPTNEYSPAVHRLLQLAANIYDATTNSYDAGAKISLPSVFRPQFDTRSVSGTNYVYISGYVLDNAFKSTDMTDNVYGIPMVIGAKKGLPSFNEYVMQTLVQGARKVELRRAKIDARPNQTNEMFILGISNLFGLEFWNSYTNPFPSDFYVAINNDVKIQLTNNVRSWSFDQLFTRPSNPPFTYSANWFFSQTGVTRNKGGFQVPLYTNVMTLTNSIYRVASQDFERIGATNYFETGQGFPAYQWGLTISNRLTYVLYVKAGGKDVILDYVHLPRLDTYLDITGILMGRKGDSTEPLDVANCWRTNRLNNSIDVQVATEGILNQIEVSKGNSTLSTTDWNDYNNDRQRPTGQEIQKSVDGFRAFFNDPQIGPLYSPNYYTNSNLGQQTPFTPTRKFFQTTSWQANDPMVHYIVEDLRDVTNNTAVIYARPKQAFTNALNLGLLNERYKPWAGNPIKDPNGDVNESYYGVKDPGAFRSDDWEFPQQKFPSIGWLGRVHRGTPWQTVYLKAEVADAARWLRQSLDLRTHPTNDWRLIDMFTVAPNANASHGQMSINQTNFAGWTAVLAGVPVLTNLPPLLSSQGGVVVTTNLLIELSSPQLKLINEGIYTVRTQRQDKIFRRLGDLLSVPELSIGQSFLFPGQTVTSPFINISSTEDMLYGLNDVAVERIPQQILSLLKVGDSRFVIYAYGQSLKPADRSIMMSGPFYGICTNYQVTGEVATRTVLQIEGTLRNPRAVVKGFNILPSD